MFKWLARFALLRFLPRRLLPILTAVQVFRMFRDMRNRQRFAVNDPRVVVARTFSKCFGMAGLRIGYAVAPTRAVSRKYSR